MTLSPADLATLVEYLDGNLDEGAMLAFEERLEAEPALGRALEEFEGIDHLQRRGAGRRPLGEILEEASRAERRRPFLPLALAAGFFALVSVASWILVGRGGSQQALSFELAALGLREASPESVNRLLGLDESWLPSRMRDVPAPGEPPPPSETEYLKGALSAQESRASEALAAPRGSIAAGRFCLVLQPDQDAWVVVVSVPRSGAPMRLYPPVEDAAPQQPLRAGRPSLLPRPFVEEERANDGSARAGFDYGFLVPLGAGELRVLTGLSEDAVTPALLAELDRRLESITGPVEEVPRYLSGWLEEHGISVGEMRVVEED